MFAAAISAIIVLLVVRFRHDAPSMATVARALRTGDASLLRDPATWLPWLSNRRETLNSGWALALAPAVLCLVTLTPSWNRGSVVIGVAFALFFAALGAWLVIESRIQLPRFTALMEKIEAAQAVSVGNA